MSFWSFIGEFAFWNMVWDRLKGKPKHSPKCDQYIDSRHRLRDYDEIENRIGDLEDELDRYDYDSDRYDAIQDELDLLEDRLDDMIYDDEIYDDFEDDW